MAEKDARMALVSEAVSAIKAIKLHSWERKFERRISARRAHEIRTLLRFQLLGAVTSTVVLCTPTLAAPTRRRGAGRRRRCSECEGRAHRTPPRRRCCGACSEHSAPPWTSSWGQHHGPHRGRVLKQTSRTQNLWSLCAPFPSLGAFVRTQLSVPHVPNLST